MFSSVATNFGLKTITHRPFPMEVNLCQNSGHVNNRQFRSKHAILKITDMHKSGHKC